MTLKEIDRSKTIEQLERDIWDEPEIDTYLVTTIHELRKKPLREFTPEDVRINLGQRQSVEILMPIAIEMLEDDPLAMGDLFPGDLLTAIFRNDVSELKLNETQMGRFRMVLESALRILENDFEERYSDFDGRVQRDIRDYLNRL